MRAGHEHCAGRTGAIRDYRWQRCLILLSHKSLWDSLPLDCRVDHIDKKNIPETYRGAIKLVPRRAQVVPVDDVLTSISAIYPSP